MRRYAWALALALAATAAWAATGTEATTPVPAGAPLQFPRDHGAHPRARIEWWYLTGTLRGAAQQPLGFQITVFRVRPKLDEANPSAFAAHQILIAHCAISDPARGRLWQEQLVRRVGLGLADAASDDLRLWLDEWRLTRLNEQGHDLYRVQVSAPQCGLDLSLRATQAPMPNGEAGYSRKGPDPRSASQYYSEPHLLVSGRIRRGEHTDAVSGEAWLDHEWASEYLDPNAVGWDWTGLNLKDGTAVMAFVIRDRQGRRYWAGGTLREPSGQRETFGPEAVQFTPLRLWRSPRSGVLYPVAERLQIGARQFELAPLLDDQELDARLSAGAIYWEGAVQARAAGKGVGQGYLELTGYERPLSLP